MKWVSYQSPTSGPRLGLVVGEEILGLPSTETLTDLLGDDGSRLAQSADEARRAPAERVELATATLRAPLQPNQLRDCGGFVQHVRQAVGEEVSDVFSTYPVYGFWNRFAVVGPYDDVAITPGSTMFDYELEVAAVIGQPARDVHPDDGWKHIVGLLIFGDWTARDVQRMEMQAGVGFAKSKDTATTLGPYLVTLDELAEFRCDDRYQLEMEAFVNGKRFTHGSLDTMDWSFAEMVAHMSRGVTVMPGEVFGSGTVPDGCLLEHFVRDSDGFDGWLQPGDEVVLSVQGCGATRQRIVESAPKQPLRTGF